MVWLGLVGLVVLGAVASVHLRSTSDDVEYGLTPAQRRARTTPDGGNTDRLLAAQRKRARRRSRNQQIAGRGGIHRPDIQVSHRPVRWWRRTGIRRR